MQLAINVSPSVAPIEVTTLAFQVVRGAPIEEDFHVIDEADQVVFQDKQELRPPWLNQRVSEYERHIRRAGYFPVRIMEDLSVYPMRCGLGACQDPVFGRVELSRLAPP